MPERPPIRRLKKCTSRHHIFEWLRTKYRAFNHSNRKRNLTCESYTDSLIIKNDHRVCLSMRGRFEVKQGESRFVASLVLSLRTVWEPECYGLTKAQSSQHTDQAV